MSKLYFRVPRTLTFDKVVALYLWLYCKTDKRSWSLRETLKDTGSAIVFEDEARPTDGEIVDVDVETNYKKQNVGSATEYVVEQYGLAEVLPGVDRVVALLNRNNTTGHLKSDTGSLVALIRELFNIGTDKPSHDARQRVIELLWPCVHAYFEGAARDEKKVASWRNPFTREHYAELLTLCGQQPAGWLELLDRAFTSTEKKKETAAATASTIAAYHFDVPLYQSSGNGIGHYIVSDDPRVARAYLQEQLSVVLLIVRRRSGNVAIFCRGKQQFGGLYAALQKNEPGDTWYHETRYSSPMILNGSTSREKPPTSLSRDQLIATVQRHYQHRARKWQAA